MTDPQVIGNQFVQQYYAIFDSDRCQLRPLYQPTSMLTFEGQQIQGCDGIIAKLQCLPFQKVQHIVTTVDAQPIPGNGLMVFVVGQLKADDDPPHSFSQAFTLFPVEGQATTSFFVQNDMFRLALHHG